MAEMLAQLAPAIGDFGNKLFISIAAGVSVARLQGLLNGHQNIVRCMPNTPSLIGIGMTGLFAPAVVNATDRQFAGICCKPWVKHCGLLTKRDINVVTAASGSGPAYFFLFMQYMVEEAQRMGFSTEAARLLVRNALGAAQMVIATQKPRTGYFTCTGDFERRHHSGSN